MDQNNGKFFVGSMRQEAMKDGWFFGYFAKNPLLKSDLVEVSWQDISGKKSESSDKHVHKKAVEINIIISGIMRLKINGQLFEVHAGEFYVVYPETIVDNVEADENTQLLIIKAPSVKGDKYYL